MDAAARGVIVERLAAHSTTAWRQPGAVLAAGGLLLAIAGEVWSRRAGVPDPALLPAAVAVCVGLLVSWHTAVERASGSPTVWFTAAIPAAAAVVAIVTEAVNAYGIAFDTTAISLMLLPVALIVTLVGAHRSRRRWKSGLFAWSMALFYLGICVGALAGIPLDTFGEVTRSDELLVWGGVLPLAAMAAAMPFAPLTSWTSRLAGPVLVAAVVPAALVSGTPVGALVVITMLSLCARTVCSPRTSEQEGTG